MIDRAAAELIAAVEQSPAAAAAHDRSAWVGLFSVDGQVEDPVGSRAHVGTQAVGRFYDTFIGPRDITFHRDLDIVHGTTVVRDLRLEVAMGSHLTMDIPAILRYDLQRCSDAWKLQRLRAYWELPAMMRQFLGNGRTALPAGVQLSRSLVSNQGLAGTVGFAAGFRRPARRGKSTVQRFVSAMSCGDEHTAAALLAPNAVFTLGADAPTDSAQLGAELRDARAVKMLAAGTTVAVSVASPQRRAVLFVDVAGRTAPITAVRCFPGAIPR